MTLPKRFESLHVSMSVVTLAVILSSCSSPPKPPVVDDNTRRPVNSRVAVDLQSCRAELSASNIRLTEMTRSVAITHGLNAASEPTKGAPGLPGTEACSRPSVGSSSPPVNTVFVVRFGVASSAWALPERASADLAARAASAAFIVVRGRTDAAADSQYETSLARRRAEAAASFLQAHGVAPDRIRVTWQGAGDPLPFAASDRGASRRVEIELYAASPATHFFDGVPATHSR